MVALSSRPTSQKTKLIWSSSTYPDLSCDQCGRYHLDTYPGRVCRVYIRMECNSRQLELWIPYEDKFDELMSDFTALFETCGYVVAPQTEDMKQLATKKIWHD